MKKLILASVLALAATAQADAAPLRPAPGIWYQGTWTCTIAHASNMKLFMTLGMHTGRAAVRQYPYYGKTEYTQLRRIGFGRFTAVTFMGRSASLSLRRSSDGVMTGSGRIGTTIMLLTCSKS